MRKNIWDKALDVLHFLRVRKYFSNGVKITYSGTKNKKVDLKPEDLCVISKSGRKPKYDETPISLPKNEA